jgi:hypothetical protein
MTAGMLFILSMFVFEENLFSQTTMSRTNDESPQNKTSLLHTGTDIKVLELRHYEVNPGAREKFISYFESNFIEPQNKLGGYIVGQYRVKDLEDNFFWMRGYADLEARSKFLPAFYFSPFWKQHRAVPNGMLLNNDNVHLLKPLTWEGSSLVEGKTINSARLKSVKGFAVVDFYIANTKLKNLIEVFAKSYAPILRANGVDDFTVWTSELTENDFPALPVFQDKNLLVMITFYKDELEYREKLKTIAASVGTKLNTELRGIITTKHTLLLYPTTLSAAGQ